MNYEQLVEHYKQELLQDKERVSLIEKRLERRQMDLVNKKRKK